MNKRLHRPLIFTAVTVLGILTLLLIYAVGVHQRRLPSPTASLRDWAGLRSPRLPEVRTNAIPPRVAVHLDPDVGGSAAQKPDSGAAAGPGSTPPPAPSPTTATSSPRPIAAPTSSLADREPVTRPETNQTASANAPTTGPRDETPSAQRETDPVQHDETTDPAVLPGAAITPEDRSVARIWLASTNDRPRVIVDFVSEDLLALLRSRRGRLVASGRIGHEPVAFVLNPMSQPPEYVRVTPFHPLDCSNLALPINVDSVLEPFVKPLPPGLMLGEPIMCFHLDRDLALQLLEELARARRLAGVPPIHASRLQAFGRLDVTGEQVRFSIRAITRGHVTHTVPPLGIQAVHN